MAGIDIDREAFVQANRPEGRPAVHLLGPVITSLAIALLAFVAYKVYLVNVRYADTTQANARVQQLNEQVAEMQKRIDILEKRRGAAASSSILTSSTTSSANPPAPKQPARTVYHITSASALPLPVKPSLNPSPATANPSPSPGDSAEIADKMAANHDAWEATTNRLANVVGVIGKQQGEISATREELNQLIEQTNRKAVSFEVVRHNDPISVGPVTLQFKSADTKSQHFTLCVFFNHQKCIELRDRALNEVVVFIVSKNNPPLELVATRIDRDQIVGYLEVPVVMQ